jgi:hypothetical protein
MEFNNALQFVLSKEGGYSNDPTDRGGATNFGISQKAHPNIDVTKLTLDDAAQIYKNDYWDKIGADNMPPEMRLVAFDAAVQHGVPTARKMIENSGGDVNKIVESRKQLYTDIVKNDPAQVKFAKGWNNRLTSAVNASDIATPTDTANTDQSKVESYVAQLASQKMGDAFIIQKLTEAGYGNKIKDALAQGYEPADIVSGFGGDTLKTIQAAQDKVGNQGFVENLGKGALEGLYSIGSGENQLYQRAFGTADDLKNAQAQEATRQADPTYQAQQKTVGSKIGSGAVTALPFVAAALATDGASIPISMAAQGGAGAAVGALTPTTADGQILSNIATNAAFGAATDGLFRGGSAAIGKGASAASDALKNVDPRAIMSKPALEAMQADGMTTIQREALARIGQTGDLITPDAIANARNTIYNAADAKLGNTIVPADTAALRPDLQNVLTDYVQNTPKPNLSSNVAAHIDDLLSKIEKGNMSGSQLVNIRKQIANDAYNQAYAGGTKDALNKIVSAIDRHLSNIAPEAADTLAAANSQWKHLQVLEKAIEKTNGQEGALTATKFATAVKQTNKDAFQQGAAPYQDLADAALKAYGPIPKSTLGALANVLHNHSLDGAAAVGSFVHPAAAIGLGAKYAASKLLDALGARGAPNIAEMIAGSSNLGPQSAMRAAIAKAMGESAPVAAGNTPTAVATKPLMLGYTPSVPAATAPLYANAGGVVDTTAAGAREGARQIPVLHSARVDAAIPNDVLIRAALKTKLANPVVEQTATASPVAAANALNQNGVDILAQIRSRKNTPAVANGEVPTAFEFAPRTELTKADMKTGPKPQSEKDPTMVAQGQIMALERMLSRTNGIGARAGIQRQIDQLTKVMHGG